MAVLTIRNLPEALHRALKIRAARHGRSMEAEVRAILGKAVDSPERTRLGTLLHQLSRGVRLTSADVDALENALDERRNESPHEPVDLT